MTDSIRDYHAHVYFSPGYEVDAATTLREEVVAMFGDRIKMGGWHDNPVGPHPRGSYQITVNRGDLDSVLPWLALNRRGLTVFCHLNTGEDFEDHTAHVIWLGESEVLKTSIFSTS